MFPLESDDQDWKSVQEDNNTVSGISESGTRTPVQYAELFGGREQDSDSLNAKSGYLWKRSTNLQRSWQRR